MKSVQSLFEPKNIAVVGISSDTSKIGSIIFQNITNSDYKGRVYPVNPKYDELFGFKVFKSLNDIKQKVDLVIISIPEKYIFELVENTTIKVENYLVISAGFSDIGKSGGEEEEKLEELISSKGANLLGPNSLGFINTEIDLNASFSAQSSVKGDVAFVSQSGALCTMMLDKAAEIDFGFSKLISVGNKPDIDEHEIIEYLKEDDQTKSIFLYLEEIEDGDKFYKLIKNCKKDIFLLSPGKGSSAKKAIRSHTGSMSTPSSIIDALENQSKLKRINTTNELFVNMVASSWGKKIDRKNSVIVTNAGGPGIIMSDLLDENRFELIEIGDEYKKDLSQFLSPNSSLKNPIDILGTGSAIEYKQTIEILIKNELIDVIFVIISPQLITEIEDTAKYLVPLINNSDKFIIPIFLGGKYTSAGLTRLYDNKIFATDSLEDAVSGANALILKEESKTDFKIVTNEGKYIGEILSLTTSEDTVLQEEMYEKIFTEFNISLPRQKLISDINELEELDNFNYPMVLKAQSKDLLHKTDTKAIFTNIRNYSELLNKYIALSSSLSKIGVRSPKLLLQEQIQEGVELFIGVNRDGSSEIYKDEDKGFGHSILFGTGGIFTEVYNDISYGLVPLNEKNIENIINSTKVSKVLRGARNKYNLNYKELVQFILKIQDIVTSYPQISEIDLNPVIINSQGIWPVDIKIILKS